MPRVGSTDEPVQDRDMSGEEIRRRDGVDELLKLQIILAHDVEGERRHGRLGGAMAPLVV